MPDRNVDVVIANSQAFSRRDVDAMLEFYAPDAVVVDRRPVGWGEFRGRDALRPYYQGLFDNAAELREGFEVIYEQGDVIVASCDTSVLLAGQSDAGEVSFSYALRITLENGLITSMDIYDDARTAVAAGAP